MNDFFIGSYYDPNEDGGKPELPKLVEGLYPCHIVSVKTETKDVRGGKYRATLYKYNAVVDKTDNNMIVFKNDKGVNTSSFGGSVLSSNAVFYFLTPTNGESFKANSGMNRGYLQFCEALNIECPIIEIDVEGEKKEVRSLPILSENDVVGKPILAKLKLSKPFIGRQGDKIRILRIVHASEWDTDKIREDPIKLPFDL